MWGSSVTREQLLQKISLLVMGKGYSLTVEQEKEIVSNLAFLSYHRKDSQNVTAICIEEDEDGQGMVIRLAVNGVSISHVEEGLRQICATLEQVSQREKSEMHDVDMFFREIVSLDFSRISAQLKLDKKIPNCIIPYHATLEKAGALLDLYRRLKDLPTPRREPTACEIMEEIIRLVHDLNQSPEFATALNYSSKLSAVERVTLGDMMSKLGKYYKASSELILAGRRKRYRIFQRIKVESFQIGVPDNVRLPSKRGSTLPLIKTLVESSDASKLLQRFKGSESIAGAALLRRLDGTRSGIKVHAEIKLIFYYETHPEKARPRVICANKSACYLCDLFFRAYGKFQVPRTFGKLNERWILPDWLDNIPQDRFPVLKDAIEQFNSVLDSQIVRVLRGIGRRPDPMESAVGLSAY